MANQNLAISSMGDSTKASDSSTGCWREGNQVIRIDEAIEVGNTQFPPGAFVVPAESKETLDEFTLDSGVTFYALEQELSVPRHDVQQLRVGMYQRYHGGNMDEGWTRLVLEQFGFPYQTLKDDDITGGAT